ncbi:MAG: hypothetical protein H0T46_03430 [Deltaproteobacteria bacterium]|nr:hypothetical protein [Deltaproteobacteria bacterium]
MTVIARDTVASDHLVYAWPLPIGPECEVACSEDEQVVMCPAWMVGDRLGPGRHRWRTPDPSRPVAAFFVLTAPVEVGFDLVTSFMIPSTGQPIRLRASGSLQVRCADPGLLVAQFVGLPFDSVNEGVLRSVSRSIERMLARLLTRRVVMAATPYAVTDPGMLPGIIEELVAYNPTAGAVFGVELIRIGHLVVVADDGNSPYLALPQVNHDWAHEQAQAQAHAYNGNNANGHQQQEAAPNPAPAGAPNQYPRPPTPQLDTIRGMPAVTPDAPTDHPKPTPGPPQSTVSGELGGAKKSPGPPQSTVSGELGGKKEPARPKIPTAPPPMPSTMPNQRRAGSIEAQTDEITHPGIDQKMMTPVPGSIKAVTPTPNPAQAEARGSIMGIGVGSIGNSSSGSGSSAAGEIATKVPIGGRVLVPGPNGLLQSATVRQLLQGYYELEVGGTGQTIWVPMGGVVPE